MEDWKEYRNTNYEVSDTGKVRNKRTLKELKQYKKNYEKKENDYMRVRLYINGKKKKKPVHRLVAECFLKDYLEELEVNHKNNLRYDNRKENLEMMTAEENYQYSITNGKGSQRKPVYCEDDKGNKKEFKSLWEASSFILTTTEHKSSKDTISYAISRCCQGKHKTIYGYKWFYKN